MFLHITVTAGFFPFFLPVKDENTCSIPKSEIETEELVSVQIFWPGDDRKQEQNKTASGRTE